MNFIKHLLINPTTNTYIQFFRYVNVGGIAFLGDWLLLFLLVQLGIHYLIAAIFSFILGLAINYGLSKALVFQTEIAKTNPVTEFLLYGVIGIVGLLLTEYILYFCIEELKIYFMTSKLIAAAIVLFWNFGARKYFLYFGRVV